MRKYKTTDEKTLRELFERGHSVKEVARLLDLSLPMLKHAKAVLGLSSFGGRLSERQRCFFTGRGINDRGEA